MKTVGGTVIAPSTFDAAPSSPAADFPNQSGVVKQGAGDTHPAMQVELTVRVDLRENLYDRWTVVSNPYGQRGENEYVMGSRPACPPNQTTYYGQAFGNQPAAGAFPGQA